MNFLAALMLLWLPRECDAFAGLVLLMRDRNLRELYKDGMAMLQVGSYHVLTSCMTASLHCVGT